MATNTRRTKQIKLTVTPELHAKLSALAEAYGQPPATLGSVLLGQVVANQLNGLQAGQRMTESVAAQFTETLKQSVLEMTK
jgi:uncharacterized protein YejL (UPF0352 family)